MNFQEEIEAMREAYRLHPPRDLKLVRPEFATDDDPLSAVFYERDALLQNGIVCWGSIIQANKLLFRSFPQWDCPATVIYSISPEADQASIKLAAYANYIFQYKDRPAEEIPDHLRELAAVITDELDRSAFHSEIPREDGTAWDVYFQSLIVFRKYIPKHKLCGTVLPIIAAPNICNSILILPKNYWTKDFTKVWAAGAI